MKTKLKGGSLSSTSFCTENGLSFIRKKVSLVENREFGFYRWLSQLKKLQRLGNLFPDLFPRVIIALNEGKNNSTAVCLDCLLEFLKIKEK